MLKNKIGIKQEDFEREVDGKQVSLFVLENLNGAELTVTNFGAKVVSILVPDKNNRLVDVVTGYNNIDDYLKSGELYFGAAIGRYGNRIANGKFELDGVVYELAQNNEPNSLHGGPKGFHAVVWDAKMIDKQTLELSYLSKDMEEGFPGNLQVKMIYRLTDENEFVIDYYAQSDKKTICNLTNHTYFNLTGEGSNTILDHLLKINAKEYLPTNEVAIPLGKPASVVNTPMDFTTPKEIGRDIEKDFVDLKFGNGYDHNFIVNDDKLGLVEAAVAFSPVSGIEMTVFTDQPGLQLYSGNYMNGTETGKTGNAYTKRSAFCLEAQHYPDSPNQSQFPSVVLNQGETYRQTTKHAFSVRK
ncbi:MAG: galactose mutarotase [Prolixibacteraceae bacterium]|nr:galactose mutarotase [Prolixibacteraceae bacterium]MBN2650686.1 galactose mutarotase [Prolixibacteraceae bacterium]